MRNCRNASSGFDQQPSGPDVIRSAATVPCLGHRLRSAEGDRRPRAGATGAGVGRSAQSRGALSGVAASDAKNFDASDQVTASLQALNLASVGRACAAERCDDEIHAACHILRSGVAAGCRAGAHRRAPAGSDGGDSADRRAIHHRRAHFRPRQDRVSRRPAERRIAIHRRRSSNRPDRST